ncbi:aromatic ring-hydroxylating dioxygenase subunit alpha [Lyngbya confervoides]|uniref:Rieske 2Fe-2S domain-containing protein n=1 Tax=Lyngbya confervoides BDU141951 TaxID=1574623 RepID=A0ABD4T1Z8_9CYAN|nr:Rieske 2Fe-2S domain-containing protein [Lyngbya confervoides]MCM1982651.1 Rieske 2Fe-2S domain-containing protein [Lyngbya confervoides BDU141951]
MVSAASVSIEPSSIGPSTSTLDRTTREVPAGGADPARFDWKEVWYPVAYIEDLDSSQLTSFTLLEEDLVIWWDTHGGQWRVFRDQCPHRLAPLSQGRVNESGHLECPYHGWAFNGSGHCEQIPQQTEGQRGADSPRACVRSLPVSVAQGLLFVYPGSPEHAPQVAVPTVEPLAADSEDWVCLNTFRDLPYDALTLLENVLDASHVPFTHHRSVGNRSNAGPVELELLQADRQGFTGTWKEGPRRGKLGQQDTRFIAPNLMWHDLTSEQFGRTMTVVYATPIRKGECRLFARFPFRFKAKLPRFFLRVTPRWYSHLGQNAVLEDDQLFLHYQERYLEAVGGGGKHAAKAFFLPTKADRFVLALHQWVDGFAADPFPGQSLPPVQSQEQLLDRYHSHTEHCASCRTALGRIRTLKQVALAAGLISLALTPLIAATGQLTVLSGSCITLSTIFLGAMAGGLTALESKFFQGRRIPPRNQD